MRQQMVVYFALPFLPLLASELSAPSLERTSLMLETEFASGEYLLGEPMLLRCTLHNTSALDMVIPQRRDAGKDRLSVTIVGPDGALLDEIPTHHHGVHPFHVAAGSSHTFTLNLFETYFFPTSGRHDIAVRYVSDGQYAMTKEEADDSKELFVWNGELQSNVGYAVLAEPTSIDKDALELLVADLPKQFVGLYGNIFLDIGECTSVMDRFPSSRYAQYARYYVAGGHVSRLRDTNDLQYAHLAGTLLSAINQEELKPLFRERVDFLKLELLQAEGRSQELEEAYQRFIQKYPATNRRLEDTDPRYRLWESLKQQGVESPGAVVFELKDFKGIERQDTTQPAESSLGPRQEFFQSAESIVADREQTCAELLTAFSHDEMAISDRVRCAELLGRLQCTPSIPILIEHITLGPTTAPDAQSTDYTTTSPYVKVLARFGLNVVPQIVRAYMNEGDPRRRELLFQVISGGQLREEAKRYAKGLSGETPSKVAASNLADLIQTLERLTKKGVTDH